MPCHPPLIFTVNVCHCGNIYYIFGHIHNVNVRRCQCSPFSFKFFGHLDSVKWITLKEICYFHIMWENVLYFILIESNDRFIQSKYRNLVTLKEHCLTWPIWDSRAQNRTTTWGEPIHKGQVSRSSLWIAATQAQHDL